MIGRRRFSCIARLAVAAVLAGAAAPISVAQQPPVQPPAPGQAVSAASATSQANFSEAKRLYDRGQYPQALPLLDTVIATLAPAAATLPPADRDLLVEAYKLRARARFNESLPGVEEDFTAMLTIRPATVAGEMSVRTEQVFDRVKKRLIGQVRIVMTPPFEATIDNQRYTPEQLAQPMELVAGEHLIASSRRGYRPLSKPFTVVAGELTTVDAAMERVSATVTLTTEPDGVEVVVDDMPRGVTAKAADGGPVSAPFVIEDLTVAEHVVTLRRDCYKPSSFTLSPKEPTDLEIAPQKLTRAVAAAKIDTSERGALIFVDGVQKSTAPAELNAICEGPHEIVVRSPRGMFIDRRTWRAGDAVTLTADLRTAFAIVSASVAGPITPTAFKASVERALAQAKRSLVFVPQDAELEKALTEESAPADWLAELGRAAPRPVNRETRRDIGRRLAARLNAQGVAAVSTNDSDQVTLAVLASGSGDPDVLTFNLRDPASYGRVSSQLGLGLPVLVKPSIDTSVIDVAGVSGAAVVAASGPGSKAGLVPGDVIVGLGGTPITSVRELRTNMMAIRAATAPLDLLVRTLAGGEKGATLTPVLVADTLPMRDPSLVYNRLFIDLQDAVKTPKSAVEDASMRLNLGIVHMRLGNWEDAIRELQQVKLEERPGVSAGTVNYLLGLSYEAVGRMADAQAALTKAAAAPQARLSDEGPLIAPLAQQKLRTLRP
jgi:tetratricopeptide (TPR) repeat protein